ncbi:MAG TPA: MBL fold metallo-hydrolase, partial [Pyrinomonadaceae bacterium]|nr:MBL fold metallo-hydrolase [Pyrinomonadaceae bacterium]
MRVVILGSGSSVPHPRRTSSAIWVETPGAKVLLDCAPSAIHRMPADGCDWAGLDAIWISHFHLDHCGGLASLLFSLKYAPET